MVILRFDTADEERRALGWLAGRFSFKTWDNGDLMVREAVLPYLARERISFRVQGQAISEHFRQNPAVGFSLIELLVVVAIITILAALLLPNLSRGKQSAKNAKCRSNLRQLGIGLVMYVNDHHHYPVAWRPTNAMVIYISSPLELLEPYVSPRWTDDGPADVWKCSQFPYPYGYNSSGGALVGRVPTLGLDGTPLEPPLGETGVKVTADMIALSDLIEYRPGGTNWLGFPKMGIVPPRIGDETEHFPHGQNINAVFCDGHVESLRRFDFRSESPSLRAKWNNDHEPHNDEWRQVEIRF